MKRDSTILSVAMATVLLLGACGSDEDTSPAPSADRSGDELRAPEPVEFTAGGAPSAATESARADAAASDAMIAPVPWAVEYVLGEGLVAPTDDTGYVFTPGEPLAAGAIAGLAGVFGVDGQPERVDDAYVPAWRIGPDDGSGPSLWVSDDAQQTWTYASAWAMQETRIACAVSASSDGETVVEEECPEPEPPSGVPTADEAQQRATELLVELGLDPASLEFETYADDWSAGVSVSDGADDRTSIRFWSFGFGGDGVLQYASGSLATPAAVGPYPLVDVETAFERLQNGTYGGFFGPVVGGPAIAEVSIAAEPAIEIDMAESGEPGMEPAQEPTDEPTGEPSMEPMPAEPIEPETVVVTLVDVQADLWWAWDIDGSVWLLPAYRFVGDDGGWYSVPAVTDEFLVQVDPPDRPMPEPMPVEPGDASGGGDVAEPLPAPDDVVVVGEPFDEFVMAAESMGYTVRVVERDGEIFAVTEDFQPNRINVVIVTVDGVEQVVEAITDDGASVSFTAIGRADGGMVPLVGIFEDVSFYPACGNETLLHEATEWYQVSEGFFPDLYAAITSVDREAVTSDPQGFAKVAPPGPGDDIGTLAVWADGVARFVSDSGDLIAWLVDDELTYDWVC